MRGRRTVASMLQPAVTSPAYEFAAANKDSGVAGFQFSRIASKIKPTDQLITYRTAAAAAGTPVRGSIFNRCLRLSYRNLAMATRSSESRRRAGRSAVDSGWRGILDRIPALAYICDANGLITYFNATAETVWGRAAKLRDAAHRFCASHQLYLSDGTAIGHEQCWMALALLENKAYCGREIVIERPDGNRTFGEVYAYPLHNQQRSVIGSVALAANITAQKHAVPDSRYAQSAATLPHDATIAMIEVAAAVFAEMPWPTFAFQ